jgi:hypothetical protein
MSNQATNKVRKEKTSPTSRENNVSAAQPASGELHERLFSGEVPVSHSTVSEGTRPSHEQIAVRAYHLWETYGRRAGTDRDDWFQAEQLLRAEGW